LQGRATDRTVDPMFAWKDWYHVTGHTYGTWLPGDPRGFRTRDHREHVEGDYRNPPPKGKYDGLHDWAKRAMKRDPVFLDMEQRRRALDELVASLQRRSLELEVCSVDRIHLHALVCVPDHDPKRWIGIAKKESSHYCKQTGHAPDGGLWATGCKCLPVENDRHYRSARKYILDHEQRGAVIYSRKPAPGMEQFDPDSLRID
jgi:hypothetical protein